VVATKRYVQQLLKAPKRGKKQERQEKKKEERTRKK
jgi:hypothetical protein